MISTNMIYEKKSISDKSARAFMRPVIDDRVFVAQGIARSDVQCGKQIRFFHPERVIEYQPLCDDFGPMNMASIFRFVELLDGELDRFPTHAIVYYVEGGRREMTNALFLLGAYMILRFKATWKQLAHHFRWVDSCVAEPFRDATFMQPDFGLTLMDCWMGLQRGIDCKWTCLPSESEPAQWGLIHAEDYEFFDHPHNGGINEVIPGKIVAFPGPVDIGPMEYQDDESGYRRMSPSYYVRIFKELGVKTVVRLNEPQYDSSAFTDHGIRHFDLYFDDCTVPPPRVVDAFLKIVDDTLRGGGLVAVHCKAGLGRTGTLIALHMMRSHGFRAREAIGWLRIMRPGSVIGDQQHFLAAADRHPASVGSAGRPPHNLKSQGSNLGGEFGEGRRCVPAGVAAKAAAQVEAGMQRRAVAKASLTRKGLPSRSWDSDSS